MTEHYSAFRLDDFAEVAEARKSGNFQKED